jgi:hypothetical protein
MLCLKQATSADCHMQVYAFGTTSVVLDNSTNTIRALMGARWAPVALETLKQMQGGKT